jgi:ADP-ribosylglycohydrolase
MDGQDRLVCESGTHADRQHGALLGLAIGDALGAPLEFLFPGEFEPVSDFQGGGAHDLRAGEWTDDTSQALALGDSLAEAGWDLDDQAERYLAWWRQGRYSSNGRVFDIGRTTQLSLHTFEATRDARRSGRADEEESGNGSLMRLAPVPMRSLHLFPDGLADLVERAVESSLVTHGSPQCTTACAWSAVVLAGLMTGASREEVLDPEWEPVRRLRSLMPLHPLIDEVVSGSYRERQPPEIRGEGWVVRSLEAALWAFHDAPDAETALLRAVNLGDDADTTGAVAGQFAGAFWGASGLPERWRESVARRDLIDDVARRLIT